MKVSTQSSGVPMRMSCAKLILLSLIGTLYFADISAAPSIAQYEVCQTESCKNIAKEYLMSMDTSIDPCNDFYRYACGNWAKNNPPEVDTGRRTHFSIMQNRTNHRLKEILESGWIADEPEAVRKAKQLYRACMDEETLENMGVSTILTILQLNGGWPILRDPSVADQFTQKSWQSTDQYYNTVMGDSPLFTLTVRQDFKASHKNVLTLAPPTDGRPTATPIPKDLFNDTATVKYKDFIKEVVRALTKSSVSIVNEAQLEQDARRIVVFETNLKLISVVRPGAHHNTTTPDYSTILKTITIAELQDLYNTAKPKTSKGQINWLKLIRQFFAGVKSVSIDSSEEILLFTGEYFRKLAGLLDNTPERDIVNAIHWSFVKQTIQYTNREMNEIAEKYIFSSLPSGRVPIQSPPRWKKCVSRNELKHPISYAYVQKYFSENAKEAALGMIHQIEMEMKKQIVAAKWLDEEAKKAAKEKIAHMAEFIGYPDWYKDPSLMDQRYQKLSVGSFYLSNMLLIKQFVRRIQLESLRKPVDKSTWIASPVDVNAFYVPSSNSITFPAGILQIPFFDAEHPDSINYGGIGAVIGHEISHGFDNQGSLYDKDGNVRQWWSDSTREEYTKRTQCFVDQFNRFAIHVNNRTYVGFGVHTLGENIADSTGMRAVFEALKTRSKASDYKDIRLPGLEDFTKEQLFFLAFAETACENSTPEHVLHSAYTDEHSAAPFRVVGTLANTEGFAKTFKCAKDTVMNPSNKCGIWY